MGVNRIGHGKCNFGWNGLIPLWLGKRLRYPGRFWDGHG